MINVSPGDGSGLAGLNILVVEDETTIAMMLEDILTDLGCTVELAPTIETAIASIAKLVLDGVLLDMNIHGRDTNSIAEALVQRSVPFLLITGYGVSQSDTPVMQSAPRLQKPFRAKDLAQRMTEVFVAPN